MKSTLRWLLLAVLFLRFVSSASAIYDPRLGRFLSRDPLREEGGINLYAYCGNDPVNRHDPTGMAPELYTGANVNGEAILELTARICNGVPQVHYSDWAHWWGPVVGGGVNDWWQAPNASELARLFRPAGNGWRLATQSERTATWDQQFAVSFPQAMHNAAETADAVAKLNGGALAAASGVGLLAEGLTVGTVFVLGHEAWFVSSSWGSLATGENYPATPEGFLLQAYGAPQGAVDATDVLVPFGAPFAIGRGPQVRMPGPRWNPLNYRFGTVGCGIAPANLQFRYVGPTPPKVYSVAFEVQLAPSQFGLRQENHFQIANEALQAERAVNPALANFIPAPAGWGRPPPNWTWQHATIEQGGGRAGVLQLVPRSQHTPGSPFWKLFHPLPGGAGGYSQWAFPAGAPPR
jgi:hypothetical protein